jgi:hypothetical protein
VSAPRPFVAGVDMDLRIGQHVCHREYHGKRVTGVIRGLSIDAERALTAHIALDAAIVIPAHGPGGREISIWNQHVPAHELTPFDDRDALIADLLTALDRLAHVAQLLGADQDEGAALQQARAVIAKATGVSA